MDKEIYTYLNDYLKSRNRLKSLVGLDQSKELILKSPNIDHFEVSPKFPKSDLSIEKHLLQKEQELDSLTWRKSKKELHPNINFHSSFGSYYSSILNYQHDFWDQINLNNFFNVGLTIDLPLYSKEKKNTIYVNKLKADLSRNKAELQLQKTEAFWKEIELEYENGIKLLNTLAKMKDISYQEFYLNQSRYRHRKITITQFLESYVNLKELYREYFNYKNTLLKQRDILFIVYE